MCCGPENTFVSQAGRREMLTRPAENVKEKTDQEQTLWSWEGAKGKGSGDMETISEGGWGTSGHAM